MRLVRKLALFLAAAAGLVAVREYAIAYLMPRDLAALSARQLAGGPEADDYRRAEAARAWLQSGLFVPLALAGLAAVVFRREFAAALGLETED